MPSGKSHSGRSPRTGLYTHSQLDAVGADGAEQRGVGGVDQPAGDLHAAVPQQLRARPGREVHGGSRGQSATGDRRWYPFSRAQTWPSASSGSAHSGHGGRPAETTRSARSANARACTGDRNTRSASGPSSVSSSTTDSSTSSSVTASSSTTIERGLGVPAQPHGADPELLLERHGQRVEVGRPGSVGRLGAEPAGDLLQQRADPLGEHRDLLLLQQHADRAGLLDRLQVEGAVAGLADGAGDEALGLAEDVDDA